MGDAVPINKYALFDPARVREIIDAFDDACRSVPEQPPSDEVRGLLAKRITELAQYGEWSREKLRDEALKSVRQRLGKRAPGHRG